MATVKCTECNKMTELVTGDVIYPHRKDLKSLWFYKCPDHDCYVGCHKGTIIPLGTTANKELRKLRSEAHLLFDLLWKNKHFSRNGAYTFIVKNMNVKKRNAHIAMFDSNQCIALITILKDYWADFNKKEHEKMLKQKLKPKTSLLFKT